MASKVPVVKQVNWIALLPQFMVIGIIYTIYGSFEIKEPFLFGVITYFVLAMLLRNLIAKEHRQAIKMVKLHQYEIAIHLFEESVDYFSRNSWVDKYRSITLLTVSRMGYKEMGLCNIAFCYSQIGEGQTAKEYYELTLSEFPENGLAQAGLKMLTSFDHSDENLH